MRAASRTNAVAKSPLSSSGMLLTRTAVMFSYGAPTIFRVGAMRHKSRADSNVPDNGMDEVPVDALALPADRPDPWHRRASRSVPISLRNARGGPLQPSRGDRHASLLLRLRADRNMPGLFRRRLRRGTACGAAAQSGGLLPESV